MEKKTYSVVTIARAARPRSKRLRNIGGSSVVNISSGGSSGSSGPVVADHTHANLAALDALSIDKQDYLYITQVHEADDEEVAPDAETHKVNAGLADQATHAIRANDADNADLWDEHLFADYLDQPLRKTDDVQFVEVRLNGVQTPDFISDGFGGTGAGLLRDTNGQAVLELDKLVVRRNLSVNELRINQVTHVGGRQILSAAGMMVAHVEESDASYRCYFETHNSTLANLFVVNDQAYCQRYEANNASVIKYYWRLVTAIGVDYIELSKSDCDGTGVPTEGDVIAQIGNRTDPTRQSMLEIDQLGGGKLVQYAAIDGYSFSAKNYLAFGVDPQSGKGYFYVYGDAFIGDRDVSSPDATFMTFQTPEGGTRPRLIVQADLHIGTGSTGLENLSEWKDKQAQIDAANEAIGQMNDDGVFDRVEKQSMCTAWENVNGVADLASEGMSGSYYTTLESVAGGGVQAFNLSDNEQFMVQKQ